jgi:hypothetical protein
MTASWCGTYNVGLAGIRNAGKAESSWVGLHLNHPVWLNLAASESLSISAAARLAAWQCSKLSAVANRTRL